MGGNVSKRIYYEDITNSEQKTALLDKFKAIYSDKNIKEIVVLCNKPYYHYFDIDNNIIVCFRYEPNLIDFVCELNRPFVFADMESTGGFCVRFVYGLKDI